MLPAHLNQNQAQGYAQHEPIAQFELGSMDNFVYLILDHATREAAIIDPQKDLDEPLHILKKYHFHLKQILLTHTHWDHTAGVAPLLKHDANLIVRVGERDVHRLPEVITRAPGFKTVGDRETFQVGSIEIEALLTPGHSAGAVSYYLKKQQGVTTPYLFTGDTIFIRDCGRTDLETGSNEEMFASIQRVKTLPPETIFLVGHHYARECATTLSAELAQSPPFQCKTVEELKSLP